MRVLFYFKQVASYRGFDDDDNNCRQTERDRVFSIVETFKKQEIKKIREREKQNTTER